jgi:general secretion pathway protein J
MIKAMSRQAGRSSGFTLVELLLAITLMSILLGLTYSGLRAATRSSERGEQLLAAGGSLRASHQFVRRQLNQMLPLPFAIDGSSDEIRIIFEGDARRIQYVAPMPGYLGEGGPQVQLIELVPGNDNDVIVQFSHALLQGFEQERLFDRDPVILLEGLESAGFEFLGKDDDGVLTDWTTVWDQQDSLPVAVRLSIEFSGDLNLHWPDLVASVKIDESAVMGGAGDGGRATYKKAVQDLMKGKDRS